MSGLRKAAEKILDLCSQDRDLSPDMLEAKLAELGLTVAQPLARERAREAYVKTRCSEMETYQAILSKCLAESGMAFNASDNEMKWTATQVARRLGLEVADE